MLEMSTVPTFSVILPVFNAGVFLERAVISVLDQTFTDFELIIVDDGSTDGAVDRLLPLFDPRAILICQPNQGAPAALNAGLAAARADNIAFIDSDDMWAPGKLAAQVRAFREHPEANVTFTGLLYIDAAGVRLGLPPRRAHGHFDFIDLLTDYKIGCTSTLAVRRSALERAGVFDKSFVYMFDIDLVLRIALLRPHSVFAIPDLLTLYRRRYGQQTGNWRVMAFYWSKLLEKVRQLAPVETAKVERRASMNMQRYFAYLAYEQEDYRTARSLLAKSFGVDPLGFFVEPRGWKLGAACACGRLPPGVHHWLTGRTCPRNVPSQTGEFQNPRG
jgi:glycosyltransferase involved in cell wall biosynthesis